MTRAALLLVAALAEYGCAHVPAWSAGDTFVESGVAIAATADYLQTRQICDDMQRGTNASWVYETNPVIGHDCDQVPPEVFFPAMVATHVGVGRLLPRPLRRLWQVATIVIQTRALGRNLRAGYEIKF
jgi:hypothetical protein